MPPTTMSPAFWTRSTPPPEPANPSSRTQTATFTTQITAHSPPYLPLPDPPPRVGTRCPAPTGRPYPWPKTTMPTKMMMRTRVTNADYPTAMRTRVCMLTAALPASTAAITATPTRLLPPTLPLTLPFPVLRPPWWTIPHQTRMSPGPPLPCTKTTLRTSTKSKAGQLC